MDVKRDGLYQGWNRGCYTWKWTFGDALQELQDIIISQMPQYEVE